MKICCFGSLNLDHVYRVGDIVHPGETISAIDLGYVCGGKGLNQSIAMARAGAQVWHAGNVGQDEAGGLLKAALETERVDVSLIRTAGVPSGHAIIQISRDGENAIIVYGGANQQITQEQIDQVFAGFAAGDMLVLQNEVNMLEEILRCAHARGMRIALNPSPISESLMQLPLELCDILFVNETEAAQICSCDEASLQVLARKFPETMIVYTMGKRGAAVFADGREYHQDAYRVSALDTTGAGDTFTGYFLAACSEGKTIEEALELAAKAAAISVTRYGASASIPMRDEVENWQIG